MGGVVGVELQRPAERRERLAVPALVRQDRAQGAECAREVGGHRQGAPGRVFRLGELAEPLQRQRHAQVDRRVVGRLEEERDRRGGVVQVRQRDPVAGPRRRAGPGSRSRMLAAGPFDVAVPPLPEPRLGQAEQVIDLGRRVSRDGPLEPLRRLAEPALAAAPPGPAPTRPRRPGDRLTQP